MEIRRRINGLVEMRPTFNKPEDHATRTELYILYDDNAVYFGGMLYETVVTAFPQNSRP